MADNWVGVSLANARYVISEKLGEGGMGAVYRAHDQNLDTEVVIKVPLRAMLGDDEFVARFKREIRSLVVLTHPHIVKISDVGEWDGLPFAVMQYLPGGSLEDRLKRARPAPGDVANWLPDVADALDFVHTRGYIHRDVKPANILFDEQGHAYLGDFGVVKVLADSTDKAPTTGSMTGAGMVIGTAEYMAPELIMGEPADGRVDQYALAATVYEMISGRPIFADSVKTKILVLQTSKPPVPLTVVCPGIAQRISDVVLKGLEKSPAHRFATCAQFAQALVEAVRGSEGPGQLASHARVRLRCPSCSKTVAIPRSDHAKLIQRQLSLACPGCKTHIDPQRDLAAGDKPGAEQTDRPAGQGSGTVLIFGDALQQPSAAAHATAKLPTQGGAAAVNATVKLAAQAGSAAASSTVKLPRPEEPSGASRTVKLAPEQGAAARSGTVKLPANDAGNAGSGTMKLDVPGPQRPQAGDRPAPPPPMPAPAMASSSYLPIALVAGAGTIALIAVIVGLAVFRPTSNPAPSATEVAANTGEARSPEPGPPATAKVALLPDAARPTTPNTAASTETVAPPGMVAQQAANPSSLLNPRTDSVRKGPAPPPERQPNRGDDATPDEDSRPTNDNAMSADDPESALGAKGEDDDEKDDDVPVTGARNDSTKSYITPGGRRPVGTPISEVLANPAHFAEAAVELKGMFRIADIVLFQSDGSLVLPVNETKLRMAKGGHLSVEGVSRADLQIEPKLAQRMIQSNLLRPVRQLPTDDPQWGDNPAIVTIQAVRQRERHALRVISFEFFLGVLKDVRTSKNSYKKRLHIEVQNMMVSGDGAKPGTGDLVAWRRPERLGHVIGSLEVWFKRTEGAKTAAERAQINAAMTANLNYWAGQAASANAASEMRTRLMMLPR
jgi:serine/threonine-protein kinase